MVRKDVPTVEDIGEQARADSCLTAGRPRSLPRTRNDRAWLRDDAAVNEDAAEGDEAGR